MFVPKFVKLSRYTGENVYVSPIHVESVELVYTLTGVSKVTMESGETLEVTGKPEEVIHALQNAERQPDPSLISSKEWLKQQETTPCASSN